MKKVFLFIIILLIITWPKDGHNPRVDADDYIFEPDSLAVASLMSMMKVDGIVPPPIPIPEPAPPKPVNECNCNKGKVSYDGGTSFSTCPCGVSGGKCNCVNCPYNGAKETSPENSGVVYDDYDFLKFTASWCGPCQAWESKYAQSFKDAGINVTHINVDDPVNKKFIEETGVRSIPYFLLRVKANKYYYRDENKVLFGAQDSAFTVEKAKTLIEKLDKFIEVGQKTNNQATAPVRVRLPVVMTRWGTVDFETHRAQTPWGYINLDTYKRSHYRNCCNMCRNLFACIDWFNSELPKYIANAQYKCKVETQTVSFGQEPTPDELVSEALTHYNFNQDEILADAGCGNGNVLITAVKKYGCKGIGIEIDPKMVELAKANVASAGLSNSITILQGDVREFDFEKYGVKKVFVYLYEDLLEELSPKLKTMDVVVSPYHKIPNLDMVKTGELWVWRNSNGI